MNLDLNKLPQHVAIIMDGNRRWARSKGLNPIEGHKFVTDNVIERLADRCLELKIRHLTLWAFSTENWDRDKEELSGMMQLFRYGLKKKADDLFKKGIRIRVLGELERFPEDIAQASREWIEMSKENHDLTVTFALNYGGRDEITRAVNRFLAEKGNEPGVQLGTDELGQYLDTAGMPDPDLIIRPGGQLRLSGFMPWQSVYAELYFTDVLMPDFTSEQFDEALADFQSRQRRFGK